MAKKTRTQSSIINIMTGLAGQVVTMLLGFITRTVFIYSLGKEYLGISGLFQNVLQVLSIADLGLDGAIVFSLYKPIANNNENKILSIMTLYKKAFRVVGAAILGVGVCLIPVLPYIMKGKTDVVNVTVVYLLYLVNTSSSYFFFSYRKTILFADQKSYKTTATRTSVSIVASLIQIAYLLAFDEYYGYLIIGILSSVTTNIFIGILTNKEYPYLKNKRAEKLPAEEVDIIKKNVFGSALYKICGVVTNSTDNLLISAMVGVNVVGIYSNYLLFTNYIQTFLRLIFNGVTASIGNLVATDTKEHKELVFNSLAMLNTWVYGFCGIALFCLINPFITLWLKDTSYLLSFSTVFLVYFNLVLAGMQYSVKSFRTASGLLWKGKFRPVATVVVNLIVSIGLGSRMGINGILLGTIISDIVTLFWYDPLLIYREVLGKSPIKYYVRFLFNFSVVTAVALGLGYTFRLLPITVGYFVVRMIIVITIPNLVFFVVFYRTPEFEYIKNTVLSQFLGKILKKR